MLRELQSEARADLILPEVVGERCVHGLMEKASCRACVDACPRGAWVIDQDMLGIDAAKCDACDLCVPACPQGAIGGRFSPSLKVTGQGGAAFAVCEYAGVSAGEEGLMPCLHAMGMSDLLQLYQNGASLLVTSCGDCESCDRGGAKRLEQRLDEVNQLLLSRGQLPLQLRNMTAAVWLKAFRRIREIAAARTLDRRSFFRNAVKLPKDRLDAAIKDMTGSFVPPGLYLEGVSQNALFPFVPVIDPERCNGCDACVRLCPQAAILFDGEESESTEFLIHAERCSGCGICVDVCEQNAVAIERLSPELASRITLQSERCRVCGADFHVPAARADGDALCWVCRRTNHHRNLYQVLD